MAESSGQLRIDLGPLAISRSSPVPLYLQLEDTLSREILAGRWVPGDHLPAEPVLAKHFGVSRSVVRQALSRLKEEGLVRRAHGAGTFVQSNRHRAWLVQDVAGFFRDEVRRRGSQVSSQVLALRLEPMPAWAADALGARERTPGVALERLRSVDGLLMVYDLNYLPADVEPAVRPLVADPQGSLYEVLEGAGYVVAGGRRIVDSVIAGSRFAPLLQIRPWDPLLVVEGVDWNANSEPFNCYRTWIRPDRMKVEVVVTAVSDQSQAPIALASAHSLRRNHRAG